jgi:hypothetical protein
MWPVFFLAYRIPASRRCDLSLSLQKKPSGRATRKPRSIARFSKKVHGRRIGNNGGRWLQYNRPKAKDKACKGVEPSGGGWWRAMGVNVLASVTLCRSRNRSGKAFALERGILRDLRDIQTFRKMDTATLLSNLLGSKRLEVMVWIHKIVLWHYHSFPRSDGILRVSWISFLPNQFVLDGTYILLPLRQTGRRGVLLSAWKSIALGCRGRRRQAWGEFVIHTDKGSRLLLSSVFSKSQRVFGEPGISSSPV